MTLTETCIAHTIIGIMFLFFLNVVLDYEDDEVPRSFSLHIDVSDGVYQTTVDVGIVVLPVNEFTPTITAKTVTWPEDQDVGASVTFTAVDADVAPHHVVKYEFVCM